MASALHFIVLLCGLWIGADVLQPVEAQRETQKGNYCETVTCPPFWTQFDRRCFLFSYAEKDWTDAERFCNSLGGNLASLRSQSEYTFIRDLIYKATNSHKNTWVGASDQVKVSVLINKPDMLQLFIVIFRLSNCIKNIFIHHYQLAVHLYGNLKIKHLS
ncbi:galactose-specific lectin nattectin-like [Morone saxatilis]|uniref:galactose-specific lectin nattectin-like n=1 Tax=Morone saxatilis TaxID=34816 RepID=UPI0015E23264|nr:galactose-specific lectin nattectin-like [Morone saxatilis]